MEYNINELISRRQELRNNPTKAEKVLWGLICKRQINNIKFRRQFGIDRYVVDFYSTLFIFFPLVGGIKGGN